MKTKWRPGLLVVSIVLPLGVGGLSALLTGDMMKSYFFLNKPPLSPPGWVFPVVWTILYVMMGLASYLVLSSEEDKGLGVRAMILYSLQLVLNFCWPFLFFYQSLYLWACIELIAMWIGILLTMILFFKISIPAGILMIPTLLWSSFALYLNAAVYCLSITPMPLPK